MSGVEDQDPSSGISSRKNSKPGARHQDSSARTCGMVGGGEGVWSRVTIRAGLCRTRSHLRPYRRNLEPRGRQVATGSRSELVACSPRGLSPDSAPQPGVLSESELCGLMRRQKTTARGNSRIGKPWLPWLAEVDRAASWRRQALNSRPPLLRFPRHIG